jgi:hypothetical protein
LKRRVERNVLAGKFVAASCEALEQVWQPLESA